MIRALHEGCRDNGFTPYLAVSVDATVRVPMEYVRNDEIVLNVGFDATSGLTLGNEWIEFKARFGGVARDILVPVDRVLAIYARENGQGMAFPVPPPRPTATVATPSPAETGPGGIAVVEPSAPAEASAPVLRLAPAATSTPPSAPAKARASRRKAPAAKVVADESTDSVSPTGPSGPAETPPVAASASPSPSTRPAAKRPALKRVK